MGFFRSCGHVTTTVWLHHIAANNADGRKVRGKLHKDAVCCFEQVLEATPHKTAAVHPLTPILQTIKDEKKNIRNTAGEMYKLSVLDKNIWNWPTSKMVREFANGPGHQGSIPCWVITKIKKKKKGYLMPLCLTLSIIRYGSRVSGAIQWKEYTWV